MEEKKYLDLLAKRDIQPTAIRILVLRTMMQAGRSVSLLDLETMLDTVDKSTIFRTLTLFLEHDVVHAFEDGRGVLCYELCEEKGACDHHDGHIHFYCESCQRSFCMEDIHIPSFELPEGFYPHSISFVIKGECPDCRKKHQ